MTKETRTPLWTEPTILGLKALNNLFKNDEINSKERSGCNDGTCYPVHNFNQIPGEILKSFRLTVFERELLKGARNSTIISLTSPKLR
jgi:hypothetical protein